MIIISQFTFFKIAGAEEGLYKALKGGRNNFFRRFI